MATAEVVSQNRNGVKRMDKCRMTPKLELKYLEICRLLNKTVIVDTHRRYEVAVLVSQVRDGEGARYGQQAMKKLAKAMLFSEESLRRYAMVVDAWKKDAFDELRNRKTTGGRLISWSHFVLIAQHTSAAKRKELLERVFEQDLSVRKLKQLIDGLAKKPSVATSGQADGLRAGVLKMTASAQATAQNVKQMCRSVFAQLRDADLKAIDQTLKSDLRAAYEAQVAAEKACRTTRRELAEVIHQVTGKKMPEPPNAE